MAEVHIPTSDCPDLNVEACGGKFRPIFIDDCPTAIMHSMDYEEEVYIPDSFCD